MPDTSRLQQFIDDELARAPLLMDQVLHSAEDALRPAAATTPGERQMATELQAALTARRSEMISRFSASLREQVASRQPAPAPALKPVAARTLALVDEAEVATDVEVSRTVEAIASVAEYELRELRAYTSALVGDMDVSRDTNPFGPAVYAQALWAAASALPLSQGFQVMLMRHAAMPLAKALRLAYAAATTRLEDAGVEPGLYRTLILPAGSRSSRRPQSEDEAQEAADLHQLRDSMPAPLDMLPPEAPRRAPSASIDDALRRAEEAVRRLPQDAGATTRAQTLDSQRMRLLDSASTRVDQQLIEMLARLFDALLADRSISPRVQMLLSRLHGSTLRVALRDPHTLDAFDHPVWQFMDRIAFGAELHPREDDPLQRKLLGFVDGLIDNIVREPVQDAALYQWGLNRLAALERHLLEQRKQAAMELVEQLLAREAHVTDTTPTESLNSAYDIGTLETVPASLYDTSGLPGPRPAAAAETAAWLERHIAGQWVRVYLQGQWQSAQLVWRSDTGTLWLYAAAADERNWALRRKAVERLHFEGLLQALRPRSLVREAALTVLQRSSGRR